MPSRNIVKTDIAESYYHIYARGSGKKDIFLDDSDFIYFQRLFVRYLSKERVEGKMGYLYPSHSKDVELLAYCLMRNHFHILIYQGGVGCMSKFMKSLMTSYSRYFNLKYKNSGPLFESRYKASRISQNSYLEHISRYIHMNPRYWIRYAYSSINYYLGEKCPEWINPEKILALFSGPKEYKLFMKNYEEHKQMLTEIKYELADK
ncbi:transposase [Candidatus Saccharibacteria bacterium]|nr:transposase [Candidatus Saccharibacteria bacterium]